jgi:septum formation protein
MKANKFWLASNSPRRREILTWAGWQLEKVSSNGDESRLPLESPDQYVLRIAELKSRVNLESASDCDFIISADTIVVLDGKVLGKPKDAMDAVEMLVSMRAGQHWVMTAVAVRHAGQEKPRLELCKSKVGMRNYSDEEIQRYVDSGDPLDKAGAYAIQDRGFHPTEDFSGCLASVMGMPLCHLERSLRRNQDYEATDWPSICQKKLEYSCPITSRIMAGEDIG